MAVSHTDSHLVKALSRLLEQYRGKPKIEAVLTAYIAEFQELEDAARDVVEQSYLPDAEGVQLDVIGRIVGEARQGRIDSLFRLWIAARILINSSQGTRNNIIACLRAVTEATFTIREYSPAAIQITFLDAIPELATAYAEIVNDARTAGVGLSVIFPSVTPGNGFTLKHVDTADDPALGFQEIAFLP